MSTRKRLRVLLLTSTGDWGGAETHTMKLAQTLAGRGHEVRVIGLDQDLYREPCHKADPPVGYRRLHLPRPVRELGFWAWEGLFRGLPGDVCILVKNWFLAGSIALDLAARCRYRSYLTIEHSASEAPPAKSSRRYLGGLLPGLGLWWYRQRLASYLRSIGPRRVVCVSEAVRARLVRDYRFAARKAVTIQNGVDAERFQPSRELRAASRHAWGVPPDSLVFGAVGRLDNKIKGYEVAVELFAALTRMLPSLDLRLVLVGEGPDGPVLKSLAASLGVDRFVCFPGFTSRPWEVYPAIDVFLMPSRIEGLPLALLEAMASGCCPIAMRAGGVAEVLSDPGLGWLVEVGDGPGFSSAMLAAARAGPGELLQRGRRSREHVVRHFHEATQLGVLADFIEASR
jgi:glycosyltransferase involved in cell wall biosynthesis